MPALKTCEHTFKIEKSGSAEASHAARRALAKRLAWYKTFRQNGEVGGRFICDASSLSVPSQRRNETRSVAISQRVRQTEDLFSMIEAGR